MGILNKEFIREVTRVVGIEYLVGVIGLSTQQKDGLMSKEDKTVVDALGTNYAPVVHDHDDRYYTETESDAKYAATIHDHDDRYYTETESDAKYALGTHNHDTMYSPIDHTHSDKLNASEYTASDVLTKIKTVDGSGSGLDADLLDGLNGRSQYHRAKWGRVAPPMGWQTLSTGVAYGAGEIYDNYDGCFSNNIDSAPNGSWKAPRVAEAGYYKVTLRLYAQSSASGRIFVAYNGSRTGLWAQITPTTGDRTIETSKILYLAANGWLGFIQDAAMNMYYNAEHTEILIEKIND